VIHSVTTNAYVPPVYIVSSTPLDIQHSSVGVVTREDLRSIHGRRNEFSLLRNVQTDSGPTQLSIQWISGAIFPAVELPGREADHWFVPTYVGQE